MILGTGIDIIEVQRVAEKVAKENGFRELVFSVNEIAYCEKSVTKYEHYAARFAAKEAFLKAAGRGLTIGYELRDVEVVNDSQGKPSVKLNNRFQELAISNNWNKIHVSLSHVQAMACAVVIIEQ